ncbi:MAG: GntR family transcriptional regulator [Anaerolineaceae bacterium]|nr:GntR family transcriptional regulator [Anaerolineaceae bacterium]
MADSDQLQVDHDSLVPLHTQLQRQLRNLIVSGQWKPGTRLPSENQLHRNLNISRSTVRQAFSEARHEGLIERIPGRGTFVAEPAPESRQKRLVAFIISDFESEREWELLKGVEAAASSNECHVVFYNTRGSCREERRVLGQLSAQQFSGALLWSCVDARDEGAGRSLDGASLPPLVLMDRDSPALTGDVVTSDNYGGASLALGHMLALGHRRIVCVTHEMAALTTVAERIQGYQDALQATCDAEGKVWVMPTRVELSTERALQLGNDPASPPMRYLMERLGEERPTAIFAINDLLALLVLRAAQALQIQVPDELSVVGFDNVEFSALMATPLTTVAQDFQTIGRSSFELLLERMEGISVPPRTLRVPVTLQVRGTTGRPADPPRSDLATNWYPRRR